MVWGTEAGEREAGESCELLPPRASSPKTRGVSGGPVVKTSPANTGVAGLIPGQGTIVPHASGPKAPNIRQKQYCNKFNKDF